MSDTTRKAAEKLFAQHRTTKEIAAELGIDARQVKVWRAERKPSRKSARVAKAPPPPPPPDTEPEAKARLAMSYLDWAEDKSLQTERVLGTLMQQIADGERVNTAGLAAMFSRSRDAREKVELIRASEKPADSEEEMREQMGQSMEDWADAYLELAFQVYGERHRGRVLFIAESGHRSEYDPVEGWQRQEG